MKIKFLKPFRFIGNNPDDGSDDTVPVGHVVDLENDESTQWLIDNGFAKEVQESGWWKPEHGEEYWGINSDGRAFQDRWLKYSQDRIRMAMGNCFKTKAAAIRYRDYLEAIATVRQDEGVMTPREIESADSCGRTVWCITYTFDSGLFVYTCRLAMLLPQIGAIYFNSRGHANASLGKHPDEWKIIANYDWSRE